MDAESPDFTKKTWQSCCGASTLIYDLSFSIRKGDLSHFTNAGFFAAKNFSDAGIFHITKDRFTASASFGSTKVNIRCSGADCASVIELFESVLKIIKR